jgi:hypothetical protein
VAGKNRHSEADAKGADANDLTLHPRRGLVPFDAIGVENLHEGGLPTPFSGPVRPHVNDQLANASNQLAVRFQSSEPPQPRVANPDECHLFRLALSWD